MLIQQTSLGTASLATTKQFYFALVDHKGQRVRKDQCNLRDPQFISLHFLSDGNQRTAVRNEQVRIVDSPKGDPLR